MLFDAVFPIVIDLMIGGIIVKMADGKADFFDYPFRILYSVLFGYCIRSSSVMSLSFPAMLMECAFSYAAPSKLVVNVMS